MEKTSSRKNHLSIWLCCLLALPLLQGCAPLIFGAAVSTTAVVVTDRRTAGAQLEDKNIGSKVSYNITREFGERVHINATSYNRRVLLTGEVPSIDVQNRVTQIASQVENVVSVFNHTSVGPISEFSARSYDSYLYTKVYASIITTENASTGPIAIVVENSVVYLLGKVTMAEGRTAARAAAGVDGVRHVVTLFEYISDYELQRLMQTKTP